jgi:hypothetical protein
MAMNRTAYQVIGLCIAEAFNNCVIQEMELSQEQAEGIIDSFCKILAKDRQEFNRDLFVDGILMAAASLEEPDPIGSYERNSRIS